MLWTCPLPALLVSANPLFPGFPPNSLALPTEPLSLHSLMFSHLNVFFLSLLLFLSDVSYLSFISSSLMTKFFFFLISIHLAVPGLSCCCGMQASSQLQHVGSSSLTKDWTPDSLHWELRVLATGPPGMSFSHGFRLHCHWTLPVCIFIYLLNSRLPISISLVGSRQPQSQCAFFGASWAIPPSLFFFS